MHGGRVIDRGLLFSVKVYKNGQARDKESAKNTQVARDPANKDDTQVPSGNTQILSGIGDEASLHGRTKDGKLVGGISWVNVRKGLAIFYLEIWDRTGASSADAAIAVARKIADQL
jgi:hypothetical protein